MLLVKGAGLGGGTTVVFWPGTPVGTTFGGGTIVVAF